MDEAGRPTPEGGVAARPPINITFSELEIEKSKTGILSKALPLEVFKVFLFLPVPVTGSCYQSTSGAHLALLQCWPTMYSTVRTLEALPLLLSSRCVQGKKSEDSNLA